MSAIRAVSGNHVESVQRSASSAKLRVFFNRPGTTVAFVAVHTSCPAGPEARAAMRGLEVALSTARPCLCVRMDRRWLHEALGRHRLHMLAGVVWGTTIQHSAACLRHDSGGGLARARNAAGLPLRTARLGDVCRDRPGGHSRVLSDRFRHRVAVPQRSPDWLEEGLAAARALAVLTAPPYVFTRDGSSLGP